MDYLSDISTKLSIVGILVSIVGILISVILFAVQTVEQIKSNRRQRKKEYITELKELIHACDIIVNSNWKTNMIFSETRYEIENYIQQLNQDVHYLKQKYFEVIEDREWDFYIEIENCIKSFEILIQQLQECNQYIPDYIYHQFPQLGNSTYMNYLEYKNSVDHIDNLITKVLTPIRSKANSLVQQEMDENHTTRKHKTTHIIVSVLLIVALIVLCMYWTKARTQVGKTAHEEQTAQAGQTAQAEQTTQEDLVP